MQNTALWKVSMSLYSLFDWKFQIILQQIYQYHQYGYSTLMFHLVSPQGIWKREPYLYS